MIDYFISKDIHHHNSPAMDSLASDNSLDMGLILVAMAAQLIAVTITHMRKISLSMMPAFVEDSFVKFMQF